MMLIVAKQLNKNQVGVRLWVLKPAAAERGQFRLEAKYFVLVDELGSQCPRVSSTKSDRGRTGLLNLLR